MPRTYKPRPAADCRKCDYNKDDLSKAIDSVIGGTLSSYQAAVTFGVPRGTVARHIAYYKRNGTLLKIGQGRPTILSYDEEKLLVTILQTRASAGFPMDKADLIDLIAEYLPNVGKEALFSHGRPGADWYANFMKRWRQELTVRKPELLTLSRALACNKAAVDAWFKLLGNKLTELNLHHSPAQIFNCDESGLSSNPGMSKIITKRGSKNPVMVVPGSGKEQFTILALASASGKQYPPFVVFTGKNLYDIWMRGGPDNALYGTSDNGWMDTNLFSNWFKQGFLKWTKDLPRPLLLIFDGHISHISLEIINLAIQNQTHLLCLPPHCSHLLQPLDVGVFKPAKDEWRKILKQWYKESRMKCIDKGQFSKLLKELYGKMKPQHAVAGFSKCGIYPYDPTAIAVDKLAPAATFDVEPPQVHPSTSGTVSSGLSQVDVSPSTPSRASQLSTAVVQPSTLGDSSQQPATPSNVQDRPTPNSDCLSTPHTAMRKAVLNQLKLCNAAVRQKTVKRKISKQFGGECLTEEEGRKRLAEKRQIQESAAKKTAVTKPKKFGLGLRVKGSKKKERPVESDSRPTATDVEPDNDAQPDFDYNMSTVTSAETVLENMPTTGKRHTNIIVGDFVKVQYESDFYPAEVTAINEELFKCNCMISSKSGWRWPAKRDELWYSIDDIKEMLGQPIPISSRGVYKFDNFAH